LHMDLCGPVRMANINGKLYVLVIVDDYSCYTWAKAIATACYTQNRSIIHRQFSKTPYELINSKKLDISFLHVFGALSYPKNDCEDIGKLGAKEVAFRRNACFVRNLEGVDLLKGDRSTNLYRINLYEMAFASPICLMARASSTKSWLWHKRLSHLNFDTINDLARNDLVSCIPKFKYHKEHLCPSCEQGKSKIATHPPKPVPNSRQRLHLLHMDLCGPVRMANINGKLYVLVIMDDYSCYTWAKAIATACYTQNRSIIHRRFSKTPYELINSKKLDISFLHVFGALSYPKNDREDIGKLGAKALVIVDDYSRYTWIHFLRSKDEAQEVIIKFLKRITYKWKALVIVDDYSRYTWIHFLRSKDKAPENRLVERRNRMLVEASRKMLIFSRAPLFLWAETIATACLTQNRSIIHRRFNKTPYERINGKKLDISFLHVFGALCYPKNDHEGIGKLDAKGDIGFFIGTMLIFSRAPLFLWAEAIATACFTQNRSIIHRRFNKTPYELINGRKPDISFLHVFGAVCYPKNDREDIRKLGDIGFFIGYSADSCAYRIYNRRTKKIMETMNVSFDELSAMVFEQRSSKPGLQCMTSRQINSGLDLTYAPSTITMQQLTESELDLLFEAMYDDYFGGQPSANVENVSPVQEPQVRQTSTTSTTSADNVPIPTNSSSHATNIPITSQDVDELNQNPMVDGNTFVNPFVNLSISAAVASSSLQNVDPSNMHTFYQPYPHEFQW
nr:integrase, catalytic region, zinc finger, CCHC-type, peptidase aspartic, catalytic [Tanacetum cinerariifolium]